MNKEVSKGKQNYAVSQKLYTVCNYELGSQF